MCGIVGVISKKGENVVPLVKKMLESMSTRGPDGYGLEVDEKIIKSDSIDQLYSELYTGKCVLGHARLAIVGGLRGSQPFRSCNGRFTLEHNGEIYNYKELRKNLKENHVFTSKTDSEVIVHLLEENLAKSGNMISAIRKTVADLDGVYAIVIKDEMTNELFLIRDKIGVRQLYYGQDDHVFGFASEKKALWKIGLSEDIQRVMPATAVCFSNNRKVKTFQIMEIPSDIFVSEEEMKYKTMEDAVKAYKVALINAMKKRTQDLERIGIIFSGGIDSVIIALLAKQMSKEVICYTGGIRGSNDIKYAKQISEILGFELKVNELDTQEVEDMLPDIITTIEETNVGQVEVAIPVYAAVKLAKSDGIRVMFSGQAADELFGGYSWYSKIVKTEGYESLQRYMLEDLSLLYKETLEREDKITMAHSIEMREPFLDKDVIETAMNTSIKLKVFDGNDSLGKRVHRLLAVELGIPKDVAYRIKEAAQHGSGLHETLDSIARKKGFHQMVIPTLVKAELQKREKLGSSQRYGYMFDDHDKWNNKLYVQVFLDNLCNKIPQLAPLFVD